MRVPTDNLQPEPGSQPSETSFAMAASVQREQDMLQAIRDPSVGTARRKAMEYMKERVEPEEYRKHPFGDIPGDVPANAPVIDRERGIMSRRRIYNT